MNVLDLLLKMLSLAESEAGQIVLKRMFLKYEITPEKLDAEVRLLKDPAPPLPEKES